MADTTVGAIAVEILARTEKLEKGMAKAVNSISTFGGIVAGVSSAVTSHLLNIGESAVSGMAGLVTTALEGAQALNDLSMRVNASITDIQALGAVAQRSGSSAAVLQDSMEKFTKILGGAEESATGGNAAKAIEMLGLEMSKLQQTDSATAMEVIADRLSLVSNASQRAFIETSLFGKAGMKLDGTLRELAEGSLNDVVEKALLTGQALNEVDDQKLVLAQQSVEELDTAFGGLGNVIAVQVAPYIAYATDLIVDFIASNGGIGPAVSTAFKYVNDALGWTINTMYLLKAGWYGFQSVVNSVVDFIIVGPLRALSYYLDTIVVSFQNTINAVIGIINKVTGTKIALLSVQDTGLSNAMDSIHKQLQDNAAEGAKGFTDNMSAYLTGKGHDDWMEFTDGITDRFQKKAELAAAAANEARGNQELLDVEGKDKKAKGKSFTTLDVSQMGDIGNTDIDPMVKEQKETNKHLKKLTERSPAEAVAL